MEYNLDDKINLLYNFIYNQNTKDCFTTSKIILSKIGLDDIKISIPDQNLNEENEYYELIKYSIMNGRFKILSFNEDDNCIYFKKYSNQLPVTVKISFYNTDDKIDNLFNSPINNDSLFSYILSELVLNKKTKHLILPLINVDVKISEIEKIISDDNYFNKIKNLIKNNNIQEICCLQLREHFFKSINLNDYLLKNPCMYKGLLFQVIHTLAVLQKEFTDFRHNNLLLKNIFIYLKKDDDNYNEYDGFKNDKFYLPNFGFDIKISNFEKSVIPKYYEINKNESNQYYDLYTFMNDLILFKTINNCDKDTNSFFEKYLPLKIRNNFKNEKLFKPTDLLYDKYFDSFKIKKSLKIDKLINNHQYFLNKYKKNTIIETYMNSDNYSILGNQNKIKSSINIMIDKRIIKHEKFSSKKKINRLEIYSQDVLVGGYDKQVHNPYVADKNTPFISNDERETVRRKKAEAPPPKEPAVLLEQKIYDNSVKPEKKSEFQPPYIPLYDQKTGEVTPHLLPYSNILGQPAIQQKVYNISLSNPIGNHTTINRIYEDMLPGQPHIFSALTIYERIQLSNFLKNTIIDNHDGEDMDITGGKNSLLSFIKVMECNPYATKQNPYHDLPRDFLLYRAAYPIRYNEKSNIEIAKQSMGMNVRMYKMSIGDIKCKSISPGIDQDNFDLWREIKYYNWVKELIVRNKISPNFISPFLYKIDTKSRIDWNKLELIKKKVQLDSVTNILINNQQKINKLHSIRKSLGQLSLILPKVLQNSKIKLEYDDELAKINESYKTYTLNIDTNKEYTGIERNTLLSRILEDYNKKIAMLKEKYKDLKDIKELDDLTLDTGKVLILLTEAPTSNILQWSGPIYDKYGTIRRMISTGYHSPDVWKSILFQLVYACAVLQKSQILIENFSLVNNIFIKDIFTDYNSIGSWIYKVNGIDYYIPNYGYILMIDSKFADINTNPNFDEKLPNEQQFKIYGKIYTNNSIYNNDPDQIRKNIINQFKNVINPDNFRHSLSVEGGGKLDKDILDLIGRIYDDTNDKTIISSLIAKYFPEFVHNRVGSLLLQSEKNNINKMSKPNFNKGNLMVYQKRYEEYEWVIYVNDTDDKLRKKIISKVNDIYKIIDVFPGSLFGYPENEKIIPESKNNMKYDENNIYETYNFDNLI
jgi:hypothetical protein